jgi:hypothetical protein
MGFFWLSDALLSYWTFRSSLMLFHRAPCWSYDKKCRQHISRNLPDDLFVWVFSSNWIIFRLLLSGEREKKHIAQPHLFTILGSIIIEHDNWPSSSFIWKHETKLHFSLKSQSDPIIHKESLFLSGFASLIELVNVPHFPVFLIHFLVLTMGYSFENVPEFTSTFCPCEEDQIGGQFRISQPKRDCWNFSISNDGELKLL